MNDATAAAGQIERLGTGATIAIHDGRTPTVNEDQLARLTESFDQLERDDGIEMICLRGRGGVFALGADLPFFVRSMVSKDLDRILAFTRGGHELIKRIAISPKRVVAWVEGAAYGAGLELALACDEIVATEKSKFSFPETRLGIYPGMGGTQRTPRRIGTGLAKWMIFTGCVVPATQAVAMGLIDAMSDKTDLEPPGRRPSRQAERVGADPRFRSLGQFFDTHRVSELLDSQFQAPSEPQLVRALVEIRKNAPLALRVSEALIDSATKLTLEDGLELEFQHLRQVFASEDALAGLLTFGQSRATFAGR